jgi:hypothetical protein
MIIENLNADECCQMLACLTNFPITDMHMVGEVKALYVDLFKAVWEGRTSVVRFTYKATSIESMGMLGMELFAKYLRAVVLSPRSTVEWVDISGMPGSVDPQFGYLAWTATHGNLFLYIKVKADDNDVSRELKAQQKTRCVSYVLMIFVHACDSEVSPLNIMRVELVRYLRGFLI